MSRGADGLRRAARIVVGLGISGLFLWLAFRGTDWGEVAGALLGLEWGWVVVSQILLFLSHFARVERWRYVVGAVRPTPFRALFAAAQLGTLMNLVLPLRLGDAVRTVVLARLGSFRLSQAIGMVTLDRLAELLGLLTVFAITLVGFPMDRDLTLPAGAVGNQAPLVFSSAWVRSAVFASGVGLVVVGVALFAIRATQRRRQAFRPKSRLLQGLLDALSGVSEGLAALRSGGALVGAYGFTVVAWLLNAGSLAALMEALGLPYEWFVPFTLLVLLAAFIVAPIAPGLVGQFHLPLIAGLLLMRNTVPLADAKAFALLAHVGSVLAIVFLGLLALWLSGLTWRRLWENSFAAGDLKEAELGGGASGD